jgi:hypothetical protein
MSVRAVAVRGVRRDRLRVVARIVTPAASPNWGTIVSETVRRARPAARAQPRAGPAPYRVPRSGMGLGFWARLTDDTQHVRLKLVLLAALVLLAMALEVPR